MTRVSKVRLLPCIACTIQGVAQPLPTEGHHLNLDGKAGQKRRGDRYTIPLCRWHHTGHTYGKFDSKVMAALYGPSLAKQSRLFRTTYGGDDKLLAMADAMLEAA